MLPRRPSENGAPRLSQEIAPHLPYLRRYARALSGSQQSGDAHVTACLEAVVANPGVLDMADGAKIALYRLFHQLWTGVADAGPAEESVSPVDRDDETTARERLATMTPEGRQVLLLTTLEGFRPREASLITGHSAAEIDHLLAGAVAEIDRQIATDVLIIEDEALISLDLCEIVESLGHRVTSVARTATQAVQAARGESPGLVLADIQLADGSSGLDAVREMLGFVEVPVIFVTSFPERLLTGERPEPTFLITKPYDPNAVKAAINQALFFRTKASLAA